jgi:hypothetical protein
MRMTLVVAGSILAVALASCGGGPDGSSNDSDNGPHVSPGETQAPFVDFDREASRAEAEAYLGLAEDEFEQSSKVRVVRRGDESYAVTMDLRPGRLNLELDDDGSGTKVVTRVFVEVPDGDDDLVVE